MPFSKTTEEHTEEYWTKHFETFLKPLIQENPEFKAHRSQALRGDILREIITSLVVSPVVVADLTDHNSNVYWELGVRQSFKHGTVTIAEKSTQLPFDIGAKGTLFYDPKNYLQMEEFRRQFKEAIQDCLVNPDRPDSHVLETLSGRGTLFEIFHRDEAIRRLDAVLSECNRNLGIMKYIVEQANENQKGSGTRIIPTSRFGVSAVELLTTTRYVDADESFFKLAERCASSLVTLNAQLNIWEYTPDNTEKWLLRHEPPWANCIKELKTKVKYNRENLTKRF